MAIRVKGLDQAIKALSRKGDDAIIAIADVLEDIAKGIEISASQDAPQNISFSDITSELGVTTVDLNIGQRIKSKPLASINGQVVSWEIFVQTNPDNRLSDFDGYMEFNTGLEAAQLLSNPNYTQEIKDLARKYYKNGQGTLSGKPYFYPNVFRYTANFEEKLEKAIKDAIK